MHRRRPRSGSHLDQIGETWYYLRVVPSDVRDSFGVTKFKRSLHTTSHAEAVRLEKSHDVEFEIKLTAARQRDPDGYPRDLAARLEVMSDVVLAAHIGEGIELDKALDMVPQTDREAVDREIDNLAGEYDQRRHDLDQLTADLDNVIHVTGSDWNTVVRPVIVAIIKNYIQELSAEHSVDWAYAQWTKAGKRPQQTVDEARRYLDSFVQSAHIRSLVAVRRPHLLDWRDRLVENGSLSAKSVNHRLEIVSAILRVGWRDAELPAPDLSHINLPEPANNRGAWQKGDLLKAMAALEPGSGLAWLFVLGLTTATRIGETICARKGWYKPLGFIEVPASHTKMKKPHVLPIIELIRPALVAHIERLADGDFLFDVPRPRNPNLKMSHEVSKWFARHRVKHGIPRVIHELRDTWIEAARHNDTVKKDLYEIISGHSAKTGSDGYGGERPGELMAANESICNDLLDADLRAAILALVA
jgi:integrase